MGMLALALDNMTYEDDQYADVLHQEKKKLRPERPDTLDTLDVSDVTCLTRTQIATAPCVRMQIDTASAYRTERGRASSFWTQPCHGIFLLDAAVSGHFPTGRVRTMRVMDHV